MVQGVTYSPSGAVVWCMRLYTTRRISVDLLSGCVACTWPAGCVLPAVGSLPFRLASVSQVVLLACFLLWIHCNQNASNSPFLPWNPPWPHLSARRSWRRLSGIHLGQGLQVVALAWEHDYYTFPVDTSGLHAACVHARTQVKVRHAGTSCTLVQGACMQASMEEMHACIPHGCMQVAWTHS